MWCPTTYSILVVLLSNIALINHFLISCLHVNHSSVQVTKFLLDDLHAVSGSDDKSVRCWDIATGQHIAVFNEHQVQHPLLPPPPSKKKKRKLSNKVKKFIISLWRKGRLLVNDTFVGMMRLHWSQRFFCLLSS